MKTQELELCGIQYLLHLPEHYDEAKTYPVIMSLHGAGTRESIRTLYNACIYKQAQKINDYPFVIVAPHCGENTWFDMWERLKAFTKAIAAAPYCDPKRLYLTGASMGGYATWQLAMSMPDCFAAIAPVCGGGMYWNTGRLVNVPVWAFHGALDKTVLPRESEIMVEKVNRFGGNAKLTVYPENAHDAWSDTYANPELYRWFLQHENNNAITLTDEYKGAATYG